MRYKIVADSCCDLTPEDKLDPHIQLVPLTLQVGDTQIIDDATFDQAAYLSLVANSPTGPQTACPSPEAFRDAYEQGGAEEIFVVTLSRHLSGTFNSAAVGAELYREAHGGKGARIHVLSSDSACVGESLLVLKLRELCERRLPFQDVSERIARFRDQMNTFFVLESLDALRKNGRLTGVEALIANTLHIKPVMAGNHGIIEKLDQGLGVKRALLKLCDAAVARAERTEERVLGITHCNCRKRAEWVKEELCSRLRFRDVYLVDAAGVASTYASDGGVVVCF